MSTLPGADAVAGQSPRRAVALRARLDENVMFDRLGRRVGNDKNLAIPEDLWKGEYSRSVRPCP